MQKINVTGINQELLEAFFLSRYYRESSIFERMSAVPGGISPFDRAIPKPTQVQILQLVEDLQQQDTPDDRDTLLRLLWDHCRISKVKHR